MTRDEVDAWIARYELAWRSPGTENLLQLFTEDAVYLQSPYGDPVVGLEEIAAMWDRERAGPHEVFDMKSEVFAMDGDRAVARVEVRYGPPVQRDYRDIWLMRFEGSRCAHFEEWAFWPDKPYAAPC
jgi:uncharacterized protein (TIGR02246 family)